MTSFELNIVDGKYEVTSNGVIITRTSAKSNAVNNFKRKYPGKNLTDLTNELKLELKTSKTLKTNKKDCENINVGFRSKKDLNEEIQNNINSKYENLDRVKVYGIEFQKVVDNGIIKYTQI